MTEQKKLCALIGFYMDKDAGERLLKNLEQYGVRSFWLDSRVENFPRLSNDPNDNSNDGLRELIHASRYGSLIDTPLETKPQGYWMSKCYAELGKEYDFIFVLGCDEYISGDMDLLMENLIKMNIQEPAKIRLPIIEHNSKGNHNIPHITERIIAFPKFVYIKNIHWHYYHNYFGNEQPLKYSPLVLGITIHHDDTIRPKIRNQVMDVYQKKKTKQEHDDYYDQEMKRVTNKMDKEADQFHAEKSKVNN